jgi:hypothetical protein
MHLLRGYILVFHRPYNNLFTAEAQRAQREREFSFSFAAETRLCMNLRRAKRWQMKNIIPSAFEIHFISAR